MSVSKRNISRVMTLWFAFSLIITIFPVNAFANNAVYENVYNIHAALNYAKEWAYSTNTDEYGPRQDRDCTNFVSQCLVAAGLQQDEGWNSNRSWWFWRGYTDGFNTFVSVPALQTYLNNKGYSVETWEFSGWKGRIYDISGRPSAGDIVQFDWEDDGKNIFNHSVLCIGEDSQGILRLASHQTDHSEATFDDFTAFRIAIIHMTDTRGWEEVTSDFIGKFVTIKSNKVNQYVYADDNGAFANRSNPVLFEVVPSSGKYGEIGEVGFRAPNGKFLSTDLNAGDSRYAPLTAKYGELQSWESFRIFRKGSDYAIQSQATGKWVQAVASDDSNHTVRAAGKKAASWEKFSISVYSLPVIKGEFFIRSTLTDSKKMMLDVYYGKDSERYAKNVQLYESNSGNNQKFKISHVGDGWHRIESVQTGKSLDVQGNKSVSGTNVIVYKNKNDNKDNQLWRFIPDGDGFRIQSKLGLYLDVSGGVSSNETNVQIWDCNGTSAQRWWFYKASNGKKYTA